MRSDGIHRSGIGIFPELYETSFLDAGMTLCTSVLPALQYMCDLCFPGSYGSTKRYKSIQRVQKINDSTIIGASGELSDFQYILNQLDNVATDEFCIDDGLTRGPKEYYAWLTQVLYARRNK